MEDGLSQFAGFTGLSFEVSCHVVALPFRPNSYAVDRTEAHKLVRAISSNSRSLDIVFAPLPLPEMKAGMASYGKGSCTIDALLPTAGAVRVATAHEAAHAFGFVTAEHPSPHKVAHHCNDNRCTMFPVQNFREEAELPPNFCEPCQQDMLTNINANLTEMFQNRGGTE